MAEKPRFRQRTVFAKNLGFGVGFGYRNNTSSVGYGSCAAVLYPLSDEEEIILQTKAVGSKVNSHQCEVEGVVLGMKMAIHYFHNFS